MAENSREFDRNNSIKKPLPNQYTRAGKAILLMYAIAFAVASVMHILIFGEPFNELTLAGALGTATGIMLLPILVIAPWCLVQRRNKPTNKPIKVGTAVFVVMLTVGTYSQIAVYNYKCAEGMIAC